MAANGHVMRFHSLRGRLVQPRVGGEDRAATFPLIPDNPTLLYRQLTVLAPRNVSEESMLV